MTNIYKICKYSENLNNNLLTIIGFMKLFKLTTYAKDQDKCCPLSWTYTRMFY